MVNIVNIFLSECDFTNFNMGNKKHGKRRRYSSSSTEEDADLVIARKRLKRAMKDVISLKNKRSDRRRADRTRRSHRSRHPSSSSSDSNATSGSETGRTSDSENSTDNGKFPFMFIMRRQLILGKWLRITDKTFLCNEFCMYLEMISFTHHPTSFG